MNLSYKILLLTTGLSLLAFNQAIASPGTLSESPLFLRTSSEANIMMVLDDSGSMDWEIVSKDYNFNALFTGSQPDGSNPTSSGNIKNRDSNDSGTANCSINSGTFTGYTYGVEFGSNTYGDNSSDCNTADDEAWRFRNSVFNPLYFDPNKTYVPWSGVDISGNPFTDINITNAPDNPYNPGETINLTVNNSNWLGGTSRGTSDRDSDGTFDGFRYYTWVDADSDGLFDNGEETEHQIKNESATTQQNFANWFSYYRSREFLTKSSFGLVIASAENVRIGLTTINNNAGRVAIQPMNADPASGAKRALLDRLYSINSWSGTPLRSTLYNAGRYLECKSNSLFTSCPALSQADGGECQQNFSILMTDGFYNGHFHLGNQDGDNNTQWDSGTSGPFGDPYSDTLADIAMNFYERDIQTSLNDMVPIKAGVDEADHQHVVNYSIAFGTTGTISAMPTNTTSPFTWPSPWAGNLQKIDDLRHAAYNSRGLFLDAEDPSTLSSALSEMVEDIADRTGSAAAVTFNTGSLEANSMVYLALFNSNRWSGQLLAYALDGNTGDINSIASWDTATELNNRNLAVSPRVILTHDGSTGIPFQWADLASTQQGDLKTNPAGGTDSNVIGEARLDFIRGDRSNEGSGLGFRMRSSRLGDIIHSAPVFVGEPEVNWPDDSPFPSSSGGQYSDFKTTYATRAGVIYVGANDGMLHGFRSDTGQEVLAYIPSNMFSSSTNDGMHYLTDPAYSHRYYVDNSPVISDAFIKTALTGSAKWSSILLGSERSGGRGMFALDVTDPSTFTEANASKIVMWEFYEADLGYTYSKPVVALMNNGKWAAIFGNGYNDTGAGSAQLFVLFLEGGLDGVWTYGTDYIKIDTKVGTSSDRNGIAGPAVIDTDGNGTADRVYAGDLRGNLWAFDLSNATPSNWASVFKTGSTPKPMFTTPTGQPITSTPEVAPHPTEVTTASNTPNVLVYFGTGQYLVSSDSSTTTGQSFYGVWDGGKANLTRSDLIAQTFAAGSPSDARVLSSNSVPYDANGGSKRYGCYFDLPDSGERVVTDPVIRGDYVYFNSMVPSTAICTSGGYGWQMSIKIENCGQPDDAVFDYTGDNIVDASDLLNGNALSGQKFNEGLPAQSSFLGDKQYTPGTDTGTGDEIVAKTVETLGGVNTGRLSWEELSK
ncbi:MAG: hypothetical protein GXP22_11305 [Gammaproteobacteria bacterium]|nr:hypothetical protein [Gammaproteobacteria bacterium]